MAITPDNPTSPPAGDNTASGTPEHATPTTTPGGTNQTPKRKVPTWLWVVGGIVVLGLVINAFGGGDSDTTADAPQDTSPDTSATTEEPEQADTPDDPAEDPVPEPEAGFGDGTYIVGENLEPGIYRSTGTNLCYWERMSGFGGTFEEIIANGNEGTIIDIAASDAGFKTERCGQWLPLEDTYPATPATEFGDGTYEVGTHIEPGRYLNSGGDNCYFERQSGFSQTFSDIISNDFGSTTAVVEIRESDRGFVTRGCGTWTKAG